MKKITDFTDKIIRIILLIKITLCFNLPLSFAEGLDPYSFDQSRNLQPVLQENFLPPVLAADKPKPLPNSAPQAPGMVTDREGNKYIYQEGKLLAKIDEEGNQSFYLNGDIRFEKDYEGKLTRTYEYTGSRALVKNEFGEITSYQEFGLGGKILKEYDEEDNLSKSYIYDGKRLDFVVDELSGMKTKYDLFGPKEEYDFEGNLLAYYNYENGFLKEKVEKALDEKGNIVDGDRTVFNHHDTKPIYKKDFEGNVTLTYNYGEFFRLQSTVDINGNVTKYYKDNPTEMRYPEGGLLKEWDIQGTKIIASEDTYTDSNLGVDAGVVIHYKNNKPLYATYDGEVIKNWIYINGKLVGIYDHPDQKLTLYNHHRIARALQWDYKLTLDEVMDWIDNNWPIW